MTSGIYKLTFNNGYIYIGKSINMENRLKQHIDKFQKGTAAANMQAAWNTHGLIEADGFIQAHEDHLDILESYMINMYKKLAGAKLLNGVIPKCISYAEWESLAANEALLKVSTVEHIRMINKLSTQVDSLHEELNELVIPDTEYIRYTDDAALEKEHKEAVDAAELLEAVVIHLREDIKQLKVQAAMPWYKRLFS